MKGVRLAAALLALPLALLLQLVPAATAAHAKRRETINADGTPKLKSKVVLVLRNKTGKALLAKRATELHAIASLTKLQVALVVRARGIKLDRGTTITREDHKVAVRGARTRLELKWVYRNRDLLHASLMASDNRATSALGRAVGLHTTALVQALNEKARRMGLKRTRFLGPVGIDHGNVSTAWEVSRIVRATGRDQLLREIMTKRDYTVKPLKGYIKVHYRNTNPLISKVRGARFIASKTGYNAKAGYCIAAVAKVRGEEYTFVLFGAPAKISRVRDLRRLINWVRRGARGRSS
ncbi:MAG: D-alanyl-D-alanine carboxypeptidase [Myxococcales bacterium]|nr:D-alanyl-D-alanine carboxypeptidase [Myxococcales bacterium]